VKSAWKLRVNENKQIEYTKELVKEIPIGKCAEAGDKCNSVIRTMGENGRELGLMGYAMWKSDTKSVA